nr:integrase, catalytic region, zinc finger, CCHC-type, peptidase aspartic, catalytic [Tanacetum cinerariifolium]
VSLPAPKAVTSIADVAAPEPAVSTGSPSSTTVDKYAPSASNSQTTPEIQSPFISNDVKHDYHDLDVAHMSNDLFFGIPIPENDSELSSTDVIHTVVHTAAPNSEHITKWTKDHPLDNIISDLQRPVSIRLQLREQALFCYYDAFLTSVEPKNLKDAISHVGLKKCKISLMNLSVLKSGNLFPILRRTMSSPNHLTSNIEDTFSEYISVVPDYSPASPGKTYSSASNNSTDVIPPTSSSFSLFHNDPYINVINAYATFTPSPIPIPPPTIKSPSPEFFLPKE